VSLIVLLVVVGAGAAIAYPGWDGLRGWVRHRFGEPPPPILVVLPLREEGVTPTHFADALSDDLAMRLGQNPAATVLARSAARALRGREVADVGRRTGASVVLAGTLQREDGELKIDLKLLDASDGAEVWSRQFTNPASSVIAAQAVMAEEIAVALKVAPARGEIRQRMLARAVNPEAYDTYGRARDALAGNRFDSAIALFEEAIRQDDGLAEAYAGLTHALCRRAAALTGTLEGSSLERVRQLASRAAAIEPDLAALEVAMGLSASTWRDSLRHLVRAATLDRSLAAAYVALAQLIAPADASRAASLTARARRLDPQAAGGPPLDTPAAGDLRRRLASSGSELRRTIAEELRGLPE
jgi:TolB-like protein